MTADQWNAVETHFAALSDLPDGKRAAALAAIDDVEVRTEVASLLEHSSDPDTYLEPIPSPVAIADVEPVAEQRIGPYRVVRRLGQGGQGAVFEAVRDDGNFHQRVAIKVVKWEIDSDTARAQFRHERQILAGLEHPHIARLLDGGETGAGTPYLVMEYVDGLPLTVASQDWPAKRKLALFLEVAAAVSYAHRNLVVHRDLKPANILVTPDGAPKLLDFGIAKLIDNDTDRTQTVYQALTPDYASPEQVRGQPITTASDVYSLGVILYKILTGRQPYQLGPPTLIEMQRVICDLPPTPPQLGDELDAILLMALRKEPERRYQSVQSFAEDIERYLANQPVRARRDTTWYRASKFARRNRVVLTAGVLAFASLAAGLTFSIAAQQRADRRFQQVRQLANVFLFDIEAQIREIPGTIRAREALVQTSLRYLDSLAAEAAGDADLQRELGIAYARVATVQGHPDRPNLGQTGPALVSYRKSLAVLEAAAKSPALSGLQLELAETRFNMSQVQLASGDSAGARESLLQALAGLKASSSPLDTQRLALLTQVQSKLAKAALNLGKPTEALAISREAQQSSRELVARQPSAANYRQLGDALNQAASALRAVSGAGPAREQTRKAVDALEQANRLEPGQSSTMVELFWAYQQLGNLSGNPTGLNVGDVSGAEQAYKKGLALAQAAVAADPNDRGAQRRLSAALLNTADLYTIADPPRAVQYYGQALEILNRLRAEDPKGFTGQRMQALVQISLADTLLAQKQPAAARPHLNAAIPTLQALVQADPKRVYYAADLAKALRISGDIHLLVGEEAAAVADLTAAHQKASEMLARNPLNKETLVQVAETLHSLGHLHETARKLRDLPKALDYFQQEVELWQKWPTHSPTSSFDQARLRAASAALDRCSRR